MSRAKVQAFFIFFDLNRTAVGDYIYLYYDRVVTNDWDEPVIITLKAGKFYETSIDKIILIQETDQIWFKDATYKVAEK